MGVLLTTRLLEVTITNNSIVTHNALVSLVCLGNKYIHLLTSVARMKLRIELRDWQEGYKDCEYDDFVVGCEAEKFKLLSTGLWTGTARQ